MTSPPWWDDDEALSDTLRHTRYARTDIYSAPAWYDVDYAAYRGEEAFYRLVLRGHVRPGGAAVELGVGTGRLALPFARDGYHMHGVEPEPAMRQVFEEKRRRAGPLTGKLEIEDGRASAFRGPVERVDVVMFPFNGVLHVKTWSELRASFDRVYAILAPEGRFALDCTGPYWSVMLYGAVGWGRCDERVHPTSGRRVLTCDRNIYDAHAREVRIDIRYVVEGDSEGVEVELHQTMWTWQQILAALEQSGFVPDMLFGDVDLAPFDEGSPRLLVSCRKRVPTAA